MFSIEESINRLKAEILAQDWRLPRKRIEPLEAAFACLGQRFRTRKHLLAIITMASNVLQYLKKRDGNADPDFIDFLKEAMAQVVNVYEEGSFDPDQDEKLFQRVYARFAALKQKVRDNRPRPVAGARTEQGDAAAAAGTPPRTIPSSRPRPRSPSPSSPASRPAYRPAAHSPIRELLLGGQGLGIAAEHVSAVRPLASGSRKRYLANQQVPLKDFKKWLRPLAGEFTGELARIPETKLKKLLLPLMVPRGLGLPLLPDEKAETMVVISRGQWHGVVFCQKLVTAVAPLVDFTPGRNGDLAGTGLLADQRRLTILDVESLLAREGFLSVVDPDFLGTV